MQIENGVVGEPIVKCGVDGVSIFVRTEAPFHGRIFVDEESDRPQCVHNYASGAAEGGPLSNGYDSKGAEFSVKFGECNMRRQRTLNPRGVSYSLTIIVSFHPIFLVGIDRAFNVFCFFREAIKAVDASIDVSQLTTHIVEREFPLPQCTYRLRQGREGPFLRFANVGEPVTHVWRCNPVAGFVYGLLVHSCFVDDGHGNRFDLIDERGCAIDRYLLTDISYEENGISAAADTHVFKYADRVQLYFTCTVQLCFKEDDGCDGITVSFWDALDFMTELT
ncbi:Protein CUTL-7 [Aphelenchoides avenae]|nr:Protein CUTL-7 [Aphelenchus avenae]